jgi:hypothetical protein
MCHVVVGSRDRVRQDLPRLVDAAHALGFVGGTIGRAVEIGVMALGEVPVCPGNLERRRGPRDAEHRVWIEGSSGYHRADSTAPGSRADPPADTAASV